MDSCDSVYGTVIQNPKISEKLRIFAMQNHIVCIRGYSSKEETRIKSLSSDRIKEEFNKNNQLTKSIEKFSKKLKTSRILFYPKSLDEKSPFNSKTVFTSLKDEGFTNIVLKKPVVSQISTNAIWYSHNTSEDEIKSVAYVLLRAGAPIKVIRRAENSWDYDNLIIIGASRNTGGSKILTVEEVNSFKTNKERPIK